MTKRAVAVVCSFRRLQFFPFIAVIFLKCLFVIRFPFVIIDTLYVEENFNLFFFFCFSTFFALELLHLLYLLQYSMRPAPAYSGFSEIAAGALCPNRYSAPFRNVF